FCRKCGQSRSALEQHMAVTANARVGAGASTEVPAAAAVAPAGAGTKPANRPGDPSSPVADKPVARPAAPLQHSDNGAVVSPEVPSKTASPVKPEVQAAEVEPATRSNQGSVEQKPLTYTLSTTPPPPDFSTPQCPACWTPLRASDKYCCWCGEPQPLRAVPFMKVCVDCNTQLPEKANFCHACGSDVSGRFKNKVRFPVELFKEEDSEFFPRFDA
ncbi:MAG TPA: zinc ribbon domain-containing protein, partial [Trichormus sp.]